MCIVLHYMYSVARCFYSFIRFSNSGMSAAFTEHTALRSDDETQQVSLCLWWRDWNHMKCDVCLPLGWYPGHSPEAQRPLLVCLWLGLSATHLNEFCLSLSLGPILHHSDPPLQVAPPANQTPEKSRSQDYTAEQVMDKQLISVWNGRHLCYWKC